MTVDSECRSMTAVPLITGKTLIKCLCGSDVLYGASESQMRCVVLRLVLVSVVFSHLIMCVRVSDSGVTRVY